MHTVYGGADRFRADTARKLGALALGVMDAWMPDALAMRSLLGMEVSDALAEELYARVRDKLSREPVEDYRIDFEDGYGVRADAEEDGHAHAAAVELARGMTAGTLPPYVGVRVKAMTEASHGRALRTLDVFLTALAEATGGALPPWFTVTLPKVEIPAQVEALTDTVEALEETLGLPRGRVSMELMVELPATLLATDGTLALPRLVDAARGRCVAVHLGAYDLLSACGVVAQEQSLSHGYCQLARRVMTLSLAGRALARVDGATTLLPIPPHRTMDPAARTADANRENTAVVTTAMRTSYGNIRAALAEGYYQGWDLHPAQLPVRYATVYAFFRSQAVTEGTRLQRFIAQAAQATQVGGVFDDAATGQGMVNFFLRALACGALTEPEVTAHTGLSVASLQTLRASRSFAGIAGDQLPR